jgi:hypothetical protein
MEAVNHIRLLEQHSPLGTVCEAIAQAKAGD